nr:helicase-related protein [uncultured Tyzzerella sp.]
MLDYFDAKKIKERNNFIFNQNTVNNVLQDLMNRGIKVSGGDRIDKTIIFAQNKRHPEFIVERFNKLYLQYKSSFAQRIICDDSYAQTIIDDFTIPNKEPPIAVSVDMMDTGIDVPECVNLVFFKKVRSKVKFWQMLGRGTMLCKGLNCIDQVSGNYIDKCRFLVFDYCSNFEFFNQKKQGYESKETKTLTENIFCKQIRIIKNLQESIYNSYDYEQWRKELIENCQNQISILNTELIEVHSRLLYVEKYKNIDAFNILTDINVGELTRETVPIVVLNDFDEFAKRFDNLIYG